jgi:RNA polymerase sigma-70 factor, ECF subfamily
MVRLSAGMRTEPRLMAEPMSMADLLRRVAERGDVEAFRSLFQAYAPRVKSYMMRQGADAGTAEDLAQETLLAVWRKASLYSGDKGSAATWIFTIARNLRIDRLRRETPWQELPVGYEETEAACDPLPDAAAAAGEVRSRIENALAALPGEQHEVVTLAFIEGLSHSEIAERLGIPMGTVKSRMRLAYQKLRGAVGDVDR